MANSQKPNKMDEIEQFLRQAAAKVAKQNQPPAQPPPRQQPPQRQQRPAQDIQYVEPEIIEAEPVRPRDLSSVSSRHVQTQGFDQRAAQRGTREQRADDLTDARLHQKFDHKVSELSGDSAQLASDYDDIDEQPASTVAPTNIADQIVKMLCTPNSVQQAIILNEILRRPEDI